MEHVEQTSSLGYFYDDPLGQILGLPTGRSLLLSTYMLPAFSLCSSECTICPALIPWAYQVPCPCLKAN